MSRPRPVPPRKQRFDRWYESWLRRFADSHWWVENTVTFIEGEASYSDGDRVRVVLAVMKKDREAHREAIARRGMRRNKRRSPWVTNEAKRPSSLTATPRP